MRMSKIVVRKWDKSGEKGEHKWQDDYFRWGKNHLRILITGVRKHGKNPPSRTIIIIYNIYIYKKVVILSSTKSNLNNY